MIMYRIKRYSKYSLPLGDTSRILLLVSVGLLGTNNKNKIK